MQIAQRQAPLRGAGPCELERRLLPAVAYITLIAEKLQLSIRTVDNHRANMMRRLQVRNAAELVRMAVEDKLI